MRVPQEQDGQTPVQFVFIEHPLCTSGIGLEGGECKQAQRPICLSSFPVIPPISASKALAQQLRLWDGGLETQGRGPPGPGYAGA